MTPLSCLLLPEYKQCACVVLTRNTGLMWRVDVALNTCHLTGTSNCLDHNAHITSGIVGHVLKRMMIRMERFVLLVLSKKIVRKKQQWAHWLVGQKSSFFFVQSETTNRTVTISEELLLFTNLNYVYIHCKLWLLVYHRAQLLMNHSLWNLGHNTHSSILYYFMKIRLLSVPYWPKMWRLTTFMHFRD